MRRFRMLTGIVTLLTVFAPMAARADTTIDFITQTISLLQQVLIVEGQLAQTLVARVSALESEVAQIQTQLSTLQTSSTAATVSGGGTAPVLQTTLAICTHSGTGTGNCTATCPSGYTVTGGGSNVVQANVPKGNGWQCFGASGNFTCYAVCSTVH